MNPERQRTREGNVWTSIVSHVDDVGWDDEWITVADLDRKLLAAHPWSSTRRRLATTILRMLEQAPGRLSNRVSRDRVHGDDAHADEAFTANASLRSRRKLSRARLRAVSGTGRRSARLFDRRRAIARISRMTTYANFSRWRQIREMRTPGCGHCAPISGKSGDIRRCDVLAARGSPGMNGISFPKIKALTTVDHVRVSGDA